MPPARSATYAARGSRPAGATVPTTRPRPRGVTMRLPLSRVRWDRKLRTAMLFVLMLVGWIGVHGILTLLATHAEAEQQLNLVGSLARANRALEAQERQLSQPATIVRDARALGMVRSNEQAYVITGLPSGH